MFGMLFYLSRLGLADHGIFIQKREAAREQLV
jgi:hypothetical protein